MLVDSQGLGQFTGRWSSKADLQLVIHITQDYYVEAFLAVFQNKTFRSVIRITNKIEKDYTL